MSSPRMVRDESLWQYGTGQRPSLHVFRHLKILSARMYQKTEGNKEGKLLFRPTSLTSLPSVEWPPRRQSKGLQHNPLAPSVPITAPYRAEKIMFSAYCGVRNCGQPRFFRRNKDLD